MISPIGLLDSGVGGLSVACEIFKILPNEQIYYFGDTANLPYGNKTPQQIKSYVFSVIDFLMESGVKAIVMACNTSTALVLEEAKNKYNIPIIGVIDPGIEESLKVGKQEEVGLFANEATVLSGAHQRAMTRISGNGVRIVGKACPELVPLVESGQILGELAEKALSEYLETILKSSADTLILGCTHYPFLEDTLKKIAPKDLKIINPAALTASKLKSILEDEDLINNSDERFVHHYMVSGDADTFRKIGSKLLGFDIGEVEKVDLSVKQRLIQIAC